MALGENILAYFPKVRGAIVFNKIQFSSQISGKNSTEIIKSGRKRKKRNKRFIIPKVSLTLREMNGTEKNCNEPWLQRFACDISITSLFDNFFLPCSNDVFSLLFPFFTLWFIEHYWGLSLLTVTMFLLSLSKDDFMIMSSLGVCSKFFVASILQHYFKS